MKRLANQQKKNRDRDNKQQSNHTSLMLQLAPFCDNEDLKKDVKFADELGLLSQKEKTSTRL